jgi:hypothetical protein
MLRAASIGTEAARALAPGCSGRVEAVFARSFYLRLGGAWLCLGEPSIGRGPLNVILKSSAEHWPNIALHAPAAGMQGALRIGGTVVQLLDAAEWRPWPAPDWSAESLAGGMAALDAALPPALPSGGLADFVRRRALPGGGVARAAAPAVEALSAWAARASPDPAATPALAVRTLLGLGPGLTPSGDDFLAGLMAALRCLGRKVSADALWEEIARHAPEATSALSLAHLRSAHRSGLSERLHVLSLDVLAGKSAGVFSGIAALARSGHHSSWDTLAGCLTAFRATCQSPAVASS